MKFVIKSASGEELAQKDDGSKVRDIAQIIANDRKEIVYIHDNINKSRTAINPIIKSAKIGVHVRVYKEAAETVKQVAAKLNADIEKRNKNATN